MCSREAVAAAVGAPQAAGAVAAAADWAAAYWVRAAADWARAAVSMAAVSMAAAAVRALRAVRAAKATTVGNQERTECRVAAAEAVWGVLAVRVETVGLKAAAVVLKAVVGSWVGTPQRGRRGGFRRRRSGRCRC